MASNLIDEEDRIQTGPVLNPGVELQCADTNNVKWTIYHARHLSHAVLICTLGLVHRLPERQLHLAAVDPRSEREYTCIEQNITYL